MRSKAILEELKAKAYTGEAAALGDALGDMVHWMAANREDLRERDVDTLMSICLALYKNELEKSWDVSIHDVPETNQAERSVAAKNSGLRNTAVTTTVNPAPEAPTQIGVENAIEAMVALRRPTPTPEAAQSAGPVTEAPRRRWTDSECWSLTLRTT